MSETRTGAQVMCEALIREGVEGGLDPSDEFGVEAALQLTEADGLPEAFPVHLPARLRFEKGNQSLELLFLIPDIGVAHVVQVGSADG